MSDMTAGEREDARRHLAELKGIVDDLDSTGMDVRLMRSTIKTIEAELGSDRAETIEAWLRGQQTGAVISYEVRFSVSRTIYKFAAVKIGGLTWYTTAATGRRQFGSAELARWMTAETTLIDCVRMTPDGSCHHVGPGFDRNGRGQRPDVEMGRR